MFKPTIGPFRLVAGTISVGPQLPSNRSRLKMALTMESPISMVFPRPCMCEGITEETEHMLGATTGRGHVVDETTIILV